MKTVNELRSDLKNELASCSHVNDNSLAAHVNENIQWAWDNWTVDFTSYYEGIEKPERYTESFRDEWIENEEFDTELEAMNDEENY